MLMSDLLDLSDTLDEITCGMAAEAAAAYAAAPTGPVPAVHQLRGMLLQVTQFLDDRHEDLLTIDDVALEQFASDCRNDYL